MKKIFFAATVAVALTQSQVTFAQRAWSAGYRTGAEVIDYNLSHDDFSSRNMAWINEAFVARRIGGRFELESGLRVSRQSTSGAMSYFDSENSGATTYDHTLTHLALSITGRLYLLQKSKLRLYVQCGTSFIKPFERLQKLYKESGKPDVVTNEHAGFGGRIEAFAAISPGLGITYNLNQRFYLNATYITNYKVDQTDLNNSYWGPSNLNNQWSANGLIGIGLRF